MPRLSPADLAVLGRYVFRVGGWQTALARELGCSRNLVGMWMGGRRPVSVEMSRRIAMIARQRHDRRVLAERASYLALVSRLSSNAARALMLSMITGEVEARIAVIGQLTSEIEMAIGRLSRIARGGPLGIAQQPPGDGIELEGETMPLSGLPKPARRLLGAVD